MSGFRNSLHGSAVMYDRSNLFLYGRIVGNDEKGLGKTFYVDSGVDNLSGESPDDAVGTLDEAINLCTAGRGDKIVVLPGHSETITAAGAVDIDVSSVSIIGLGIGTDIPTIEFNHASATVTVDADNIYIENIRFNSSITSVAVGVDVLAGATDVIFNRCIWDVDAAGTDEFTLSVRFNAGCDRGKVMNCYFEQGLAAAVAAISLTGASDHIEIGSNQIWGDYSTANINGITTLSTNVFIHDNLLVNGIAGNIGTEPAIELLTGTHGVISNNYIVCNLATKLASIVADACFLFENYYNEDVAQTGGIIGTASADD